MPPKKTKTTTASQKPPRSTPSSRQTTSSPGVLYGQIAKRAFEIYERRIRQGALDDWLQAEREILQRNTGYPEVLPHRGGYAGPEQE